MPLQKGKVIMTIERPFKKSSDFEYLRKVIMREVKSGPAPIIELGADNEIMAAASGITDFPFELAGDPIYSYMKLSEFARKMSELTPGQVMEMISRGGESMQEEMQVGVKMADLSLAFSNAVGYDYVTVFPIVPIPRTRSQLRENPQQQGKVRMWQDEHHGVITSRREFEEYPWPTPDKVGVFTIDMVAPKMPPGMKVMFFYLGIFEDLKILMGFEEMAIKSIEEPELLVDILENLTVLAVDAIDRAAAHPATGAIFYGEDMGFNTGTMLTPKFMRKHVIPRHKRIADACHKHGKPFLFHSCGQIDALMDDLIDVVGIDAKHSFTDNIEPVEQVYKRYGDRIAILGGVDVDLLTRGTQRQVRARVRSILDVCGAGGGFAMGSGNSITNYCNIENYYAMIDETRKWNEERGFM